MSQPQSASSHPTNEDAGFPFGEFSAVSIHWWSSPASGAHAVTIDDFDLRERLKEIIEIRRKRHPEMDDLGYVPTPEGDKK